MKAAVIVFPASNCDRDVAVALGRVIGRPPAMIWHRETALPPLDLIVLPGGFAFGDYLRVGAIAARSPVMTEVAARAKAGVPVLGICNGFQVLTEAGLLPGALIRNQSLGFISRTVPVRIEATNSVFTRGYGHGQVVGFPIAHHDGNYRADAETLARLEGEGRVAFRYVENPNGSAADIAGIFDERRNVLGLMPHPERAVDPVTGSTDGRAFFEGLVGTVAA